MKLSRKQAFGVAAVIALIVAVLLFVVLSRRVSPPRAPEPQTVTVVMARANIPAYTELAAGMLETKKLPRDQAPFGALSDPVEAIGQLAQFELEEGQTLTRRDVIPAGARQGLTFVIGEGMRAVTVALDPISGVGGFAQPTDRVDVVATFDRSETTITKTVLQDVEVLAINEQTIRPPAKNQNHDVTDEGAKKKEEEAPATLLVKSATLAVTPPQAQILILSAARGTIHLVLRPRSDHSLVALEPVSEWGIRGGQPPETPKTDEELAAEEAARKRELEKEEPEKEEPEKEAEEPEGPPPPTVTVIRGSEREVVVME